MYFGLQGDAGLPGPSGTPGDGSLRSEITITIYKGEKVTQQGKTRSRQSSAFTSHSHTGTDGRMGVTPRQQAICGLTFTMKRSSDCSTSYSHRKAEGGWDGEREESKGGEAFAKEMEERLITLNFSH